MACGDVCIWCECVCVHLGMHLYISVHLACMFTGIHVCVQAAPHPGWAGSVFEAPQGVEDVCVQVGHLRFTTDHWALGCLGVPWLIASAQPCPALLLGAIVPSSP